MAAAAMLKNRKFVIMSATTYTMMTSDFRQEVEIRQFRTCAFVHKIHHKNVHMKYIKSITMTH